MKKILFFACILLAMGCQKKDQKAELAKAIDTYYEEQLKLNPVSATSNGDNRFNDQLSIDFTDAHRAKIKSLLDATQ
jgi:hypothetical protein